MTTMHRVSLVAALLAAWPGGLQAATSAPRPGAMTLRPETRAAGTPVARRLGLRIYRHASLDDAQLGAVMRQVARIWEPYGFRIVWSEDALVGRSADLLLRVMMTEGSPGGESSRLARSTIGWIEFLGPGRPSDVISVSVGAARRMMDAARLFGRPVTSLASGAQDRFMTQALGRSLAHEIGHYLLATAEHAPSGLMRARFSPAELLDVALDAYRLDPPQACELMRRGAGRSQRAAGRKPGDLDSSRAHSW